jgi:hypothetical protein
MARNARGGPAKEPYVASAGDGAADEEALHVTQPAVSQTLATATGVAGRPSTGG